MADSLAPAEHLPEAAEVAARAIVGAGLVDWLRLTPDDARRVAAEASLGMLSPLARACRSADPVELVRLLVLDRLERLRTRYHAERLVAMSWGEGLLRGLGRDGLAGAAAALQESRA